jgi:alkylated DNA repair protein (DNA oxidative demethylase)
MAAAVELAPGLILHPGYLDAAARRELATDLAACLAKAPPYRPRMPRTGRPLSVAMTNCGALGWVSDITGYRYQARHPETGTPWPPIPSLALRAWDELAGYPAPPEACLVNLYAADARMGLHQDRDEAALDAPVLSLSLGASAVFRYGGPNRRDPTRSVRLHAGDALIMGGPSRLVHHGIDRLLARPPDLLGGGEPAVRFLAPDGRCNLTLRRVTQPRRVPAA